MDKQIAFKLDSDVYSELKARAAAQGNRSVTSLIREILRSQVSEIKKQSAA